MSVNSSIHGSPVRQFLKSPAQEALELKIAEKESEYENLQEKFDRLVEAKGDLEEKVKNLTGENDHLKEKMDSLSENESSMRDSIGLLQQQIESLEAERKAEAEGLEDGNVELMKLREEVERFRDIQEQFDAVKVSNFSFLHGYKSLKMNGMKEKKWLAPDVKQAPSTR